MTTEAEIKLSSTLEIAGDEILITQRMTSPLERLGEQVTRWRLNTTEKQTRAALIKLGWTPPQEGA